MKKLLFFSTLIITTYACRFDSDCSIGHYCIRNGNSYGYCSNAFSKKINKKNYNFVKNRQNIYIKKNKRRRHRHNTISTQDYILIQEYNHKQQVKQRVTNKYAGKEVIKKVKYINIKGVPKNISLRDYILLQEYRHKQQVSKRITNQFNGK